MNARWTALALLILTQAAPALPKWASELSPPEPGSFPLPRPAAAEYRIGWAAVSAANATIAFGRAGRERVRLEGKADTTGLARALWRMDTSHSSVARANTLQPERMIQIEKYRSEEVHGELRFGPGYVEKLRYEKPRTSRKPLKWKRFKFPRLHDMHTAYLYIRSQALGKGDTVRLVVYPGSSPYLLTAVVAGREPLRMGGKRIPVIKVEIKLHEIEKDLSLATHKKFQRATVWISDDAYRIPIRAEADVFVGSVWAELRSYKPAAAR